jgi:hypothetical protein
LVRKKFINLFKEFINFFLTKYYNNIKYSNSFLSITRIFFERTTRQVSSVSKLGNVYRNSKWVSLSVQNIKPGLLSQQVFIYLFLFVVLLSILTTKFYFIKGFILSELFNNSYFLVKDFFSYFFLISCSLLSFLLKKVSGFLFYKELDKLSYSKHILTKKFSKEIPLTFTKSSYKIQKDILLTSYFLNKSTYFLEKLDKKSVAGIKFSFKIALCTYRSGLKMLDPIALFYKIFQKN